jgi:1-deoxy-D-xylulose-5-phosphate reductoisomerase
VTFRDNSVKAQLGVPDMRLPIQWALLFPERTCGAAPILDLMTMGPLTFEPPDLARFPALGVFRHAMKAGGTAPAVMNAANEVAVHAFLDGATGFYGITDCVETVLERHRTVNRPSLDDIYAADAEARRTAHEFLQWKS